MPRNPRPAWRGIGGRHAAESGAGIGRNTHKPQIWFTYLVANSTAKATARQRSSAHCLSANSKRFKCHYSYASSVLKISFDTEPNAL
jgi:hypothetical protein